MEEQQKRCGEKQWNRIQLHSHRAELISLSSNSQVNVTDPDTVAWIKQLEAKVRSLEKAVGISPIHLYHHLYDAISTLDSVKLLVAPYQADSCICRMANLKEIDLILSADTDYSFLMPTTVRISSFHMMQKQLTSLSITAGVPLMYQGVIVKEPKHKCLEFLKEDASMRILVMIALGCDVHPGGVSGVGPKTVSDIISKLDLLSTTLSKDFIQDLIKVGKDSVNSEELQLLHDCILFEPAIHNKNSDEYHYMFHPPSVLPLYLSDFACNTVTTVLQNDSVHISTCSGNPTISSHKFISRMSSICMGCLRQCCKHCVREGKCLECISFSPLEYDISYQEMINKLETENVRLGVEATYAEVFDIYTSIVENKSISIDCSSTYPVLSSHFLEQSHESEISFMFGDGAQFIQEISQFSYIVALIHIFAELVNFQKCDLALDSELPCIIRKFAEGSRKDSALRLKKRCIRHTIDVTDNHLHNCCGEVFNYGGKHYIRYRYNVKASFRDALYTCEVAYNEEELLSCSCSCKAGSTQDDRHTCVHTLPGLLLLSRLVFDGFGESFVNGRIFIKITNRWIPLLRTGFFGP